MPFMHLYHADLYSDLWKSYLYFRPAKKSLMAKETISEMTEVELKRKLYEAAVRFFDKSTAKALPKRLWV